jgi:uncharacterized protein (DUF1697 family)
MKHVAIFRNVYLGQRGNPNRQQLEAAYLQAGASTAVSFLANGTLVFSVPPGVEMQAVNGSACGFLQQEFGLNEPAFVHTLGHLGALVAEDPFAAYSDQVNIERSVAFFAHLPDELIQAPLESPRKECLIFRFDPGMAFAIRWQVHGGLGYPTPILEKALKRPVTTRNWNTILRLVAKFG